MVYGEGLPATAFFQVGSTRVFVKNFAGAADIVGSRADARVTAVYVAPPLRERGGALNEAFSDMYGHER